MKKIKIKVKCIDKIRFKTRLKTHDIRFFLGAKHNKTLEKETKALKKIENSELHLEPF